LAAVDWYSIDGLLAYKALALNHFESVELTIGEDIANGFRRIRQDALKHCEQEAGPQTARELELRYEKHDAFFESQFREAALLGIAKNGLPDAAGIAKPFLSQDAFGLLNAAVKVVCTFGDSECVHDLLRIAKSTYGDLKKEAALGALKFSPKPFATATEFLKSDDKDLVRIGFSWLLAQDSARLAVGFREFLQDADADFRLPSLLCVPNYPIRYKCRLTSTRMRPPPQRLRSSRLIARFPEGPRSFPTHDQTFPAPIWQTGSRPRLRVP
jgi:hypothetical protein